ncbi:glycosyltransferase [Massilia sp. LjRoot122]|uniref:glycosyltransferase n=1 Tax=Massilia sp. LjRoot122 TaxID=3342257 RepID=UPI003ECDFEAD
MTCFLYAWELGSNFGHVGAFKPVAERLRQAGHDVALAVRETRSCQDLLGEDWTWLQAPRFDGPADSSAPLTYADMLAGVGYSTPPVLTGLVVAWRTLMRLVRPRLVFADHAPTAILAARSLGIPVMLFGTSFTLPPRRTPFPAMRPWESVDESLLAKHEAAVLDTVNLVLARFHARTLAALYELFDVAEDAMLALPELDHYGRHGAAAYWGLLTMRDGGSGRTQGWPPGQGPRLFAYLRGQGPASAAALAAMRASGNPCIVYLPDADLATEAGPNLSIIRQPASLEQMLAEAHIVAVNGTTTAGAFLMAGKPVLVVARHLEQYLFGMRVAQMGAGLVVRAEGEPGQVSQALRLLLSSVCFAQQARAFSEKYAAFDHGSVLNAICRRAITLATIESTI